MTSKTFYFQEAQSTFFLDAPEPINNSSIATSIDGRVTIKKGWFFSIYRIKLMLIVVVWKGIHSGSNTNRTETESLFFYYPRLLYYLYQMLAVMLLSQHRVSSSKTVRPRAPCGARCIGHAVRTWSTVCSEAPHSQFSERARLHLCMDEWNCPTPVRRRLSLTQAVLGKLIPTGLALVMDMKARNLNVFSQCSVFQRCQRSTVSQEECRF